MQSATEISTQHTVHSHCSLLPWRAAVAFTCEEVPQTPQCIVQMELTGDLERGIKRIGMCSSVKLKVVQHDIQHYVLGLVKSNN